MRFITKKEQDRRQKVSVAMKGRHEISREKKKRQVEGEITPAGRRIVDLALLARSMWCDQCNIALSFKYMEKETQYGLNSIFQVRCTQCLQLHQVPTSSIVPESSQSGGRPLYAVNCKLALGCVDSGVGHEQLNKLLSAVNLPVVCRNTIKLAEERVANALVETAAESCKEALAEEKEKTVLKRLSEGVRMDCSPPSTPPSSPCRSAPPPQETPKSTREPQHPCSMPQVGITVTYDFGWDKRGNGFKYDSHSGRGSIIGQETKKILGYKVFSSYCYMCARGLDPNNHVCARNYQGSAKAMEPKAAVDLCVKNPDLKEAGVTVCTLVGDRDSSTMAALRRESPHPIRKVVDINHNTKSINNALWKLKKGPHKFLTTEVIDYLKRAVAYTIKQNINDVEAVRNGIMNISRHTFGEHDCCGAWCNARHDPENYLYKHLPGKKAFSCPVWRRDLEVILKSQADQAEQLAPAGSSLQNESFNQMCNTRAPKSRHYAGTNANFLRVSAAVCNKNLGSNHLERSYKKALLSPSTSNFRERLEASRRRKEAHQNKPEVKKRRLHLKMKNSWKEAAASQSEGCTYVSGMANAMERAADAASVDSWLPDKTPLLPGCRPVIVDIETTGLSSAAEIVQLAARCGDEELSAFMLPRGVFSPEASTVTGMRVEGGRLWRHGECLQTVPASSVARDFVEFLKRCSSQVVLVGHNIVRFDGPRIMKFLSEHGMAKELCNLVFGFTDTLPLISQGKMKKQDVLAKEFLTGPQWTDVVRNAHDAAADCFILDGLLQRFEITDAKLIESVLPVRDFMERAAANKKKRENTPALMVMAEHGVSKCMIGKMAASGITIQELLDAYILNGRDGLVVCLGVQLGGKPRVTKAKKVIDQVEKFVKSVN